MPPDELLYQRITEGDGPAFDLLYARYEKPLFGFLLRLCGNRETAEEVFHEAFVTVLKARKREPGSFRAWLYCVARNLCLNHLRSRARERRATAELGHGFGTVEAARTLRSEIGAPIDQLPPFLADVYRLRLTGMSYDEMAAALGVPLGTIKSRMHELVKRLREETWIAE